MGASHREFYAEHVAETQRRWEAALEAEGFAAVAVHSGTPMYAFQDDYEYAFRPNPHFLAWLPLTHHADSLLLVLPGERPRLFYFQPDDYWYLPPSDPESWWADHFDIEIVRDAMAWRERLGAVLSSRGLSPATIGMVGDWPALEGHVRDDSLNTTGHVTRLQLWRTRKTPYEVACMDEASRLAAAAHLEAERAFREGASEFDIHLRYQAACRQTDTELPYNNIVALNTHGAVLHYQARDREPPATIRSFLIDAGCVVNAYASDITRTYARAPGDFADLIAAMDGMEMDDRDWANMFDTAVETDSVAELKSINEYQCSDGSGTLTVTQLVRFDFAELDIETFGEGQVANGTWTLEGNGEYESLTGSGEIITNFDDGHIHMVGDVEA